MPNERRPEGRHQPLFDLATAQHGIVSARQLRDLGYSRTGITEEAKAGRLHRLHRGVYAVGHLDLDWHSRCFASVLACAPALASHASAGWIWGLLRYEPGTIDVTAPTRRHPKSTIRLHHARLDERDRDQREGIPVTSLARTLLDLATTLPTERLERVIERSEELELFDLAAVDELLERVTHHPGMKSLRRALAIYRPEPAFTRSGLERRFLVLVKRAGLPVPSMNFNVNGLELDAYWSVERFAVELDVYETHGSNAAFERDRIREEDLKLDGVDLIRITGPRLRREPEQVMERLERHLARRRRELTALAQPLRPRLGGAR